MADNVLWYETSLILTKQLRIFTENNHPVYILLSFFLSYSSLFWFSVCNFSVLVQSHCTHRPHFQLQQVAAFSEKDLKTIPYTAKQQSYKLAVELKLASSSIRHVPKELVKTTKVNPMTKKHLFKWMLMMVCIWMRNKTTDSTMPEYVKCVLLSSALWGLWLQSLYSTSHKLTEFAPF